MVTPMGVVLVCGAGMPSGSNAQKPRIRRGVGFGVPNTAPGRQDGVALPRKLPEPYRAMPRFLRTPAKTPVWMQAPRPNTSVGMVDALSQM